MVFCAESLDDIGILAQDVDGVKTVASLLCADWVAEQADTTSLDLPTLGVPEGPYLDQMPPNGLARFQSLLEELQALGYHVKRVPLFEQLSYVKRSTEVLVAREMAEVHRNWFSSYERLYAARTRENIFRGQSITESEYQAARDHRVPARQEVEQQAERFGIDSWIAPATLGPAPVGTNTTGDSSMSLPWSYVGLPAVTCPAWKTVGGLPVGLQLIGRSGSDEHLLAYADDLSRRLDGRVTAPIW
jgi:Asp-tRNA(Asn)/Glu-tRNA(Gln) amidotransferase A subunit family amidase